MHIRVGDEKQKDTDPRSSRSEFGDPVGQCTRKKNIRLHICKHTETDRTDIVLYRTQTNLHIHTYMTRHDTLLYVFEIIAIEMICLKNIV